MKISIKACLMVEKSLFFKTNTKKLINYLILLIWNISEIKVESVLPIIGIKIFFKFSDERLKRIYAFQHIQSVYKLLKMYLNRNKLINFPILIF